MTAICQNSYALSYVKQQTEEMCLVAVRQNGWTLEYVQRQTEAICLAAIKQTPYAIAYVQVPFLPAVRKPLRLRALFDPEVERLIQKYE